MSSGGRTPSGIVDVLVSLLPFLQFQLAELPKDVCFLVLRWHLCQGSIIGNDTLPVGVLGVFTSSMEEYS